MKLYRIRRILRNKLSELKRKILVKRLQWELSKYIKKTKVDNVSYLELFLRSPILAKQVSWIRSDRFMTNSFRRNAKTYSRTLEYLKELIKHRVLDAVKRNPSLILEKPINPTLLEKWSSRLTRLMNNNQDRYGLDEDKRQQVNIELEGFDGELFSVDNINSGEFKSEEEKINDKILDDVPKQKGNLNSDGEINYPKPTLKDASEISMPAFQNMVCALEEFYKGFGETGLLMLKKSLNKELESKQSRTAGMIIFLNKAIEQGMGAKALSKELRKSDLDREQINYLSKKLNGINTKFGKGPISDRLLMLQKSLRKKLKSRKSKGKRIFSFLKRVVKKGMSSEELTKAVKHSGLTSKQINYLSRKFKCNELDQMVFPLNCQKAKNDSTHKKVKKKKRTSTHQGQRVSRMA